MAARTPGCGEASSLRLPATPAGLSESCARQDMTARSNPHTDSYACNNGRARENEHSRGPHASHNVGRYAWCESLRGGGDYLARFEALRELSIALAMKSASSRLPASV